MPERRYSRYKRAEVIDQAYELQKQLHIKIVPNSFLGSTVKIIRLDKDHMEEKHTAVILARSSDWYDYSLNSFDHDVTAIIAGTHDSCIDKPVLALDTLRWYALQKIRSDWGALQPKLDQQGNLIPDTFDKQRRTHYGHNMFIGALMQRRPDALARLQVLPTSTRLRIEAKLRKLHKRKVGHPLSVA